ncbi:sugar ABC transporter permease [Candidatus Gracilibacteria bacterium]|nr:sugar ABC transporter permease [Candidatus Gracilibacteria bacterium]
MLPALTPYLLFMIVPLLLGFYYSFTDLNPLFPDTSFVGLQNYRDLPQDSDFLRSVRNTLVISVIVTLLTNVLGLGVALLLNHPGRLFYTLRTLFFVPQVLSAVIVSFIWSIILTQNGILNTVLRNAGLGELARPWLGLPGTALGSIMLVVTWQALGFCVVVYLATLQSIPADLFEAARIDGGNRWEQFRHITFPLLAPGMTITVVLTMISVFKLYDHVAVLTAGGPAGTTETLSFNIIKVGFTANQAGYSSAMAVVLFVVIGCISVALTSLLRRREVTY